MVNGHCGTNRVLAWPVTKRFGLCGAGISSRISGTRTPPPLWRHPNTLGEAFALPAARKDKAHLYPVGSLMRSLAYQDTECAARHEERRRQP